MKSGARRTLIAVLVALGLNGMVAQAVYVRELLVLFAGNELTIGLVLALWVLGEAAGALAGGLAGEKPRPAAYLVLWLLHAYAFPQGIDLARSTRTLFGVLPGASLAPAQILGSIVLTVLPLALVRGLLFTASCRLFTDAAVEERIGRVYLWETVGTVLGGVLASLWLLPLLPVFEIALALFLVNSLLLFLLACHLWIERRALPVATALAAIAALGLLASGIAVRWEARSLARAWPGQNVVLNENSPYQNIVVTRQGSQYSFFTDGALRCSLPVPDIAFEEEFVHFVLLSHPAPRSVLVIEFVMGDVPRKILMHPSVVIVDCVELDPELIDAMNRYTRPPGGRWRDPRLRFINADARRYIATTTRRYDVVQLGIPAPGTLSSNRYFTIEFFTDLHRVVNPGGLIAFTLPGSEVAVGPDLRLLQNTIFTTMRDAGWIPHVIPGERMLVMASAGNGVMPDVACMESELARRNIGTQLITSAYLDLRLTERSEPLADDDADDNRDFRPKALLAYLAYWQELQSPGGNQLFRSLARSRIKPISLFLAFTVVLLVAVAARRAPTVGYAWVIGTTGFSGMILQLSLVYAYQVACGRLYVEIALLLAAFMAGAGLGGWHGLRITAPRVGLVFSEAALIAMNLAVSLLLLAGFWIALPDPPARIAFLALLLLSGYLTGVQFPLVSRTLSVAGAGVGRVGGFVYAADLTGGALGALLGGAILLPTLGFPITCGLLALLKLTSALFFVPSRA